MHVEDMVVRLHVFYLW